MYKCVSCQPSWPLNFTQSWVCASLEAWMPGWAFAVLNLKRNKGLRKELRLSQRTSAQRSDRSVVVWLNLSIFIFLEVSFSVSTHALLLYKVVNNLNESFLFKRVFLRRAMQLMKRENIAFVMVFYKKEKKNRSLLRKCRGTAASCLARLPPDSERSDFESWSGTFTVLCSRARQFTLTVPLSTQVYKWIPVNLILGSRNTPRARSIEPRFPEISV